MQAEVLKGILYDDQSHIINVLESCGVHSIKKLDSRIQGAREGGDNATSIQIITKDKNLGAVFHTDASFKGGDIISLVEHIKEIEFLEAIDYICSTIGVENTYEYKPKKKLFGILDTLFGSRKEPEIEENIKLHDDVLNQFFINPHYRLTEQGVSVDTQIKFQTGYDIGDNRLLTPIRDEDGDIVTIKGRTLHSNYKELDIPKFVAYYPYKAVDILYGLYENQFNIYDKHEAIVIESEKGVQQGDSINVDNCIATSKKKISVNQVNKIISLQCKVVLAFDKDVDPYDIIIEANKFEGYLPVEIVYDFNDLLTGTQSPLDVGRDVWYNLYESRMTIEQFKEWFNE